MVRVFDESLIAANFEYRPWYMPRDIIAFAPALGMGLSVALGSRANVHELIEMIEVIEPTLVENFQIPGVNGRYVRWIIMLAEPVLTGTSYRMNLFRGARSPNAS